MKQAFVLFGMARTGSTLLASLLNSHPQIQCDGEIFRSTPGTALRAPLKRLWQHYPWPILAYRQMRAQVQGHRAVYGFKLHTKLQGDQIVDIPSFLQQVTQKGWRIIYLERHSLFNQVISSLMAYTTGRYFGHQSHREPLLQLELPTLEFYNAMQQTIRICQRNRAIVAELPHITILYETDLAHEHAQQTTMARIFTYLGLSNTASLQTSITKPWSCSYAEMITNYDDLLSIAHELASTHEELSVI